MARRFATLSVGLFLAGALALSIHAEAEKAKTPAKASGGKAVMMAADELKWIDPANSPPGVKMAVLWGDPAKGAHGAMHKFPAGFSAPLHFHTAGHHVIVVSGTLELTPEGEAAKKLVAGSYFSFTGKKKHVTTCMAGADCVLFVDCGGPWDVVMADAAKKDAPKKDAAKK
jgi:quercetin dioxygenase-like cupin family protein